MNATLRSLLSAGGIVLCTGAMYGGIALRSHIDLDTGNLTASKTNSVLSTWVSSRDNSPVSVSAADYYGQMVSLLKQYYVEPITNDEKLATGSVRGMIASLGDPQSVFMDSKEFAAYVDRQRGIYQGIGVDLMLDGTQAKSAASPKMALTPDHSDGEVNAFPRVPRLLVAAVVPGGPAERAGVKVGDRVSYIDDHWVVDQALVDKVRQQVRLLNANKITYSQYEPYDKMLRDRSQRALFPLRAADKLLLGTSGTVEVTWQRGGTVRRTRIAKRACEMPGFSVAGETIRLPMTLDAVARLAKVVKGRTAVVLDLRNDPEGSFAAVPKALEALVPAGNYGEFVSNRHGKPSPLSVGSGNSNPPRITLLVDRTTRGPAEILALALSSHGRGVLKGATMGGDLGVSQTVELPDGTGYSLATSDYRPISSKPSLMAEASRSTR